MTSGTAATADRLVAPIRALACQLQHPSRCTASASHKRDAAYGSLAGHLLVLHVDAQLQACSRHAAGSPGGLNEPREAQVGVR